MKIDFPAVMGRALDQIRAGKPGEATRTIQAALAGQADATPPRPAPDVMDAEIVADTPAPRRRPLREVVDMLSRATPRPAPGARPTAAPGARYESRSFAGPHGARDYRLYQPAPRPGGPQGIVLMLHGCTQTPDDFACGTGMNAQADRHGLILIYPHQSRRHNAQGCWNWFRPTDQHANTGEPALLAALARSIAAEFNVTPGRTFAAGLSAGGAMAAILGATHPDLFAAIGVHSGLPHGAAHDLPSALAAMRGEGMRPCAQRATAGGPVPTIVFHGLADTTVHPSNGAAVIAAAGFAGGQVQHEQGRATSGRAFRRARVQGADGRPLTELWQIEGAGHGWSGGAAAGSYTDPTGPDASAEMVRFFLETA